jgi:TetR/AcrR family transcriptional repressor of bet genes
MGRPSNTQERRLQIVRALQEEMAESGYERASVACIARRAGLAPGLVHYHFKNKLEILMALVDHLAANLEERRKSLGAGNEPREALRAVVQAHLATGPGADASAVACWVMIAAEAVRQPEVRSVYARVIAAELEHLRQLVGACAGVPKAKAAGIAAGILAAIQGFYQLGVAVPGAVPAGSAGPTLERFIDGILSGEPGGRR